MTKTKPKVQESGNAANKWRVGLVAAVVIVSAAALSGAGLGKPSTGGGGSPVAAVDAFMPGMMITISFQGNEQPKAFEIKDFSFGVENPTTIGSATGGAGAGKIKFNEFTIKKTTDAASPRLFKACAIGEHFTEVVFEITHVDKKGRETPYLTYQMETVFVTKIDWSGPGDEGPEESITFVFGKLGVTYHQIDDRTGEMTDISFGWDQVTNKEDPVGSTD